MKMNLTYLSIAIILTFSAVFSSDNSTVVIKEKSVNLINIRNTSRVSDEDSTIYLYLQFDKKSPNYFYEIIPEQKKLILSLVNTKAGGFTKRDTAREINMGPVKTILIDEKIKDKNEDLPGLNPEWYYVTEITLQCNPVPKTENIFDIISDERTISLTIPWPNREKKRSELYFLPRKKRTGLIAALTGIGIAALAGTGLLIWDLLGEQNESQPLEPVLPEHPATK